MSMSLTDEEIEQIRCALFHYHKIEYRWITSYEKVIENRVEVEEGIFAYYCPCQTIYLDSNHYAVTYGRQHVIENEVYYDFNENTDLDVAGTYEYLNTYEWKRNTDIWG